MKTIARYLIPRLVLVLLPWTPGAASAQSTAPLSRGDHVRVTWDYAPRGYYALMVRRSATLDLVHLTESQLMGRRNGQLVIVHAPSITSLERRIGTRPATAPEMVIGSAAGFAVGFLAGAFRASVDSSVDGVVDAGISSGVLIGAPLGALAAWLNSRSRGTYEDVGLPGVRPVVAMAPSGGVGLALAINSR